MKVIECGEQVAVRLADGTMAEGVVHTIRPEPDAEPTEHGPGWYGDVIVTIKIKAKTNDGRSL